MSLEKSNKIIMSPKSVNLIGITTTYSILFQDLIAKCTKMYPHCIDAIDKCNNLYIPIFQMMDESVANNIPHTLIKEIALQTHPFLQLLLDMPDCDELINELQTDIILIETQGFHKFETQIHDMFIDAEHNYPLNAYRLCSGFNKTA